MFTVKIPYATVIAGFPDDRPRERALNAGEVCFLGNPFDTGVLLTCIRSALGRRRGTQP